MLVESTSTKTLGSESKDNSVIDECISTIKSVIAVLEDCPHCREKLGVKAT